MKKLLLFLTVVFCMILSVAYAQDTTFSNATVGVTYTQDELVVSGSFTSSATVSDTYNIILAHYEEDGRLKKVEMSGNKAILFGKNTFTYNTEITDMVHTVKPFVWTKNMVPICTAEKKTIRTFRVFSIGNSFSEDATKWLYDIAKNAGFDNVIVGYAYIGGCTLQTHYNNAKYNSSVYRYSKNEDGTWKDVSTSASLVTGLRDEKWDVITLQQASGYSGIPTSYDTYLPYLIKYVNKYKTNPNAKLAWHMTCAYQGNSTHGDFSKYANNQMTMYNAIVSTVNSKVLPNEEIAYVIPSGTAIQNARTSFVGDTLTRDGYHLTLNFGRFVAGMTWFHKITGMPIDDLTYVPDKTYVTSQHLEVAKQCVKNAVQKPYEVTSLGENTPVNPQPQYDFSKYELLDWEPLGSSYYYCTTGYNRITGDATSKRFISSKRFKKGDLPNGALIVIDSGYQYRPEGWVAENAVYTGTRPDNVTTNIIEISDSWWGSFNYRAFNIAVAGANTDISGKVDEVASHFRIYVPKKMDGFDVRNYSEIDWEPQGSSYYLSTSGSNKTTSATDSYANNFISSKMFSKADLPDGTLLVVDSGYQYRPEGWKSLSEKNTARPGNVTTNIVVIDDEWWGSFNYRAFNVAVSGANSNISGKVAEVASHFRIYVPKYEYEDAIACWGDSLTYGDKVNSATQSYPAVLASLTGMKVYNLGVRAETSTTIAARQGTFEIKLTEAVTIPASDTVDIKFAAYEDGRYAGVVAPAFNEGYWNPCTINGVEGTLTTELDYSGGKPRPLKYAKFTRKTTGTAVECKVGDELIPNARNIKTDINVFFTGTNRGWTSDNLHSGESPEALVKLIKKQIEYANPNGKYVVIGLTYSDYNDCPTINAALKQAFASHFIDLREYFMSAKAFTDAGITISSADQSAISSGKVPAAFLASDGVHYNVTGYRLLANLVKNKLVELGYIEK